MAFRPKADGCLRLKDALLALHHVGARLMKMHTRVGSDFYVIPGGRVSHDDAAKILQRPDVIPFDDGLFPGNPQSWKLMR